MQKREKEKRYPVNIILGTQTRRLSSGQEDTVANNKIQTLIY